jgi:tetratricopeptide (TPR) repeat protein
MNRYDDAIPMYRQWLSLWEKTKGKDWDYSGVVHRLAVVYEGMGNYNAALPLYQENVALREKLLGCARRLN